MSRVAVVIGYFVFACCQCFAAEQSTKQAFQKLSSAPFFAFGGVGYAGSISQGEKAFREMCASSNALPLFKAALTNENPSARIYALCGIRTLDPKSFDQLAKPLVDANPSVLVMSGCMLSEEPASKVVSRIKNGAYDAQLKIRP